jgi:proteic killer suppression protein
MKVTFKNKKLEKSLTVSSEIVKTYGSRAKKVKQRMDEIRASANVSFLMQIPAANCHELKGSLKGIFPVDISGNWRILFEPDCYPVPAETDGSMDYQKIQSVKILEVKDYH